MVTNSSARILAIDDEPFILSVLARTLKNLGYTNVKTCDSALDALNEFNPGNDSPDLIFLDLNMPQMDGVEFMRNLVDCNYRGNLVLFSGEDERVLQAAVKLAHEHKLTLLGHVRKPVRPEALVAILRRWRTQNREDTSPAEKRAYGAEEINRAISNDEIVNYYLPKVSLATKSIIGWETLVRWMHPVDGLVLPDQFVGVAEDHGIVGRLTRKVMATALQDAHSWRKNFGMELGVSINISVADLNCIDFADFAAATADATNVPSTAVTLEVTGSQIMQNLRAPLDVLTRLRLKRFRIAIDDFGTGYSSIAQLRYAPFDELKIERGFVHRAWTDKAANAFFDASVLLATQLGMQIVTEGVEDRADWDYVRRSKCNVAQGYFIGKPMPAASLRDGVEFWDWRAATAD